MIRISAAEFWPRYRDECRSRVASERFHSDRIWTSEVAIPAAKAVCEKAGLKTCSSLNLDVAGYEQRDEGVDYNWDLRVAFEHENTNAKYDWYDELCKLCHVVADLRVLVSYFSPREDLQRRLQDRIDVMGRRMTRVPESEWLFIFGPLDSSRDRRPWVAYVLDDTTLRPLPDDDPFNPHLCLA